MNKMAAYISSAILVFALGAKAQHKTQDLLIKLAPGVVEFELPGAKVEKITENWVRVQAPRNLNLVHLAKNPAIEYVQPNFKIKLPEDYSIQDSLRRAALAKMLRRNPPERFAVPTDNPAIPDAPQATTGPDPLFPKQWGMLNIGVEEAWKVTKGSQDMIVAVLDTGVDYTHEDLVANLWRNPKEIPNNGIDDDGNGYIDDVIGWDFAANDNKPYDLTMEPLDILFKGGNPGHGTHCAGNVAARGDNGKGIAGAAPNVKIMALRFLSEKGEGTTADAIKAIKYAVDNGAKVLSNSWGSEGEDPNDGAENKALRDVIQYAQDKGALFIAAAGNGHSGVGYNNDTDAKPGYPASYTNENIISVAAIDSKDQLGSFSNWGPTTVDIGAPGVQIFSTMVDNKYSDVVIDLYGFKAYWDGTSMATPHVAGAAALYWSAHPEKAWQDVKAAILGSAKKVDSLQGKVVSDGKLDAAALLKF
ncbi:MAG: S8 family serine peptidase [Bdellovibrio sp.]|nr:S8 family serine peptidase [Bdellovibrio sp.]